MRTATWSPRAPAIGLGPALVHAAWFGSGAVVGFLIPFIFSSTLDLHHDLYYSIYFALTGAFLAAYAVINRVDVVDLFTRRWKLSLAFGVLAAAAVVFGVLSREDSTPRPDGWYLWFEVAWRGVAYGAVDALLLTAFPVAVAYAIHGQRLGTWVRRATFAGLSMVLVLVITAAYHLGYEQFRDDGVQGPETGNAIISLPAIATANPLGAIVAHSSMHVAAALHAYETDVYLPPQTDAD